MSAGEDGDEREQPGALQRRRRALGRGRASEALAVIALRLKGYRILARNFRCKAGEIDIIARRGEIIAFVEVKARADAATAVDAVGHQSRRRIANAANYWLARQPGAATFSLRFDIIAVRPWRWPLHFEDAF